MFTMYTNLKVHSMFRSQAELKGCKLILEVRVDFQMTYVLYVDRIGLCLVIR